MMRNMTSLIGRLNEKNRIRSLLQFLAIAAHPISIYRIRGVSKAGYETPS